MKARKVQTVCISPKMSTTNAIYDENVKRRRYGDRVLIGHFFTTRPS